MFNDVMMLIAAVFLLIAAVLSVAAGVGVIRFPDVLTKLHAVTKPQVLGVIATIVAISLALQSWMVFFALLPVFVFQSLTAPVAAHMVGRASYRTGVIAEDKLLVDELAPAIEQAPEDDEPAPDPESEPVGFEHDPETFEE